MDSSPMSAIRSLSSRRVFAFFPVDLTRVIHSLNSKGPRGFCNSLSSKSIPLPLLQSLDRLVVSRFSDYQKGMLSKIQETLYFLTKYPVFTIFGTVGLAFTVFDDKI